MSLVWNSKVVLVLNLVLVVKSQARYYHTRDDRYRIKTNKETNKKFQGDLDLDQTTFLQQCTMQISKDENNILVKGNTNVSKVQGNFSKVTSSCIKPIVFTRMSVIKN